MIKKITYEDKVAIQNDTDIADINKVTDNDMNEIKAAVNNNADDFTTFRDKVDNNQLTGTAEGDNIYIDDAYSGGTAKMTLLGKSEQETRSGKNKLKLIDGEYSKNGVTLSVKNNEITCSGTSTDSSHFYIYIPVVSEILNGDYTLSANNTVALVIGCQIKLHETTSSVITTHALGLENINATQIFRDTNGQTLNYIAIRVPDNSTWSGTIKPQLEPGTVATEYEPYGAMPSPDYPSNIQNIEGDVEVGVVGKNLFDKNQKYTSSNIPSSYWEITQLDTGIRLKSSYPSGVPCVVYVLKDLSNFIGKTVRMKANYLASATNNGQYILGICNENYENKTSMCSSRQSGDIISFVVPELEEGIRYLFLALYVNAVPGTQTSGNYIDYTDLIITINNEDMTYEPYQSQTANFTFTEGQKLMEGGYLASDGVHNVRGQITVSIRAITTLSNGNIGGICDTPNKIYKGNNMLICSNAIFNKTYVDGTVYENPVNAIFVGNSTDTLESIKAKYDGAILEYELAEPVITPYTAEQQAQWDKLQNLQLFDGINNISSPATMQLTYVKSTASVINNLQDQINELKQAIL